MTSLRRHLHNLNDYRKAIRQRKPTAAQGSYSTIDFGVVNGSILSLESFDVSGDSDNKATMSPINVAVSSFGLKKDDVQTEDQLKVLRKRSEKAIVEGQKLLAGVHCAHLEFLLFYDDQANKVSLQAEYGDLFHFIRRNRHLMKKQPLQYVVSQMLVAVQSLHDMDLAHFDIKPENFLLGNMRNEKGETVRRVRLADFDGLNDVDHETGFRLHKKPVFFTDDHLPPEMQVAEPVFDNVNSKAIDCCGLGVAFERINDLLETPDPDLADLTQELKEHRSLSHEKVKNHKFFLHQVVPVRGSTADVKESQVEEINIVEELEKISHEEIFSDGYYVSHLEPGNAFYLMPEKIKEIYIAVEKLANQLYSYSVALSNSELDDKCSPVDMYNIIRNNIKESIELTLAALKDKDESLKNYQSSLQDMLKDLYVEQHRFRNKIPAAVKPKQESPKLVAPRNPFTLAARLPRNQPSAPSHTENKHSIAPSKSNSKSLETKAPEKNNVHRATKINPQTPSLNNHTQKFFLINAELHNQSLSVDEKTELLNRSGNKFWEDLADELQSAFSNMRDKYIKVNNLQNEYKHFFFSFHGADGRDRVRDTEKKILDLYKFKRTQPKESAIEIFKVIHAFLESNQGNWLKTSSKTMLMEELKQNPFFATPGVSSLYQSWIGMSHSPLSKIIKSMR